jgi:hypothetical protein
MTVSFFHSYITFKSYKLIGGKFSNKIDKTNSVDQILWDDTGSGRANYQCNSLENSMI